MPGDIQAAHQRWQAARRAELAVPDSWLGLIGLVWLEEGENRVGNCSDCAVVLPAGPARLGSLWMEGAVVAWQAAPSTAVDIVRGGEVHGTRRQLLSDRDGAPSEIVFGSLVLIVIERAGRLAVRLRDRDRAATQAPPQLEYFPYDPAWRIGALWQALSPPLAMQVPNVSGELATVLVTHQARFSKDGFEVTLLPVAVGEQEVFFVFRDRTSGGATYGAGRFLKVPVAADATVDGKICLDFNFAYSPPCAFTPFATCPLPPPENWLPFALPAGEKKPRGPASAGLPQRPQEFLTTAPADRLGEARLLLQDRHPALVAEHAVDFADVVAARGEQGLQFPALGARQAWVVGRPGCREGRTAAQAVGEVGDRQTVAFGRVIAVDHVEIARRQEGWAIDPGEQQQAGARARGQAAGG